MAYRYFSTDKRKFIIADCPGHEQYTRNMATGASTCDLAVVMIDARKGVLTQSRRHSFIVSLLGLKHVVVAINKMDLVDYSEERFNEIEKEYRAYLKEIGGEPTFIIPISAREGDNITYNSLPPGGGAQLCKLRSSVAELVGGVTPPLVYGNRSAPPTHRLHLLSVSYVSATPPQGGSDKV